MDERWTALTSRTKQYELDSEPSILRCDVLVHSEVQQALSPGQLSGRSRLTLAQREDQRCGDTPPRGR